MTKDEVRKMIDDVDDNKDGRLDYREVSGIKVFSFYIYIFFFSKEKNHHPLRELHKGFPMVFYMQVIR